MQPPHVGLPPVKGLSGDFGSLASAGKRTFLRVVATGCIGHLSDRSLSNGENVYHMLELRLWQHAQQSGHGCQSVFGRAALQMTH